MKRDVKADFEVNYRRLGAEGQSWVSHVGPFFWVVFSKIGSMGPCVRESPA